jgi:hypothetical protein
MYSAQVVVTSALKFGIRNQVIFDIEYGSEIPVVKRCCFSSPTGMELVSTITLADVVTYEDLEAIARQIHEIALRRLEAGGDLHAQEATVKLLNVQWPGYDPNGATARPRGVEATASVGMITVVSYKSRQEIKAILEAPSSIKDVWLEMLHLARTANNPVVEFLGYYQVVAAVFEDPPQKILDNFFEEFDKSMPPLTAKPRSNQTETVYTRLRNELVHVRKRSQEVDAPKHPLDVRTEVVRHLPGLRRLAGIAIEKHS